MEKSKGGVRLSFELERFRHSRKGNLGKLFAFAVAVAFFSIVPLIGKNFYPDVNEDNQGYCLFWYAIIFHQLSFIGLNLVYLVVYKLKIPFLEHYKTTKEKWPWDEDYKNWKILLSKTLKLVSFNHLVVFPLSLAYFYIANWCPFDFNPENKPGSIEFFLNFAFFLVIEDTVAYFGHRGLHHKSIYSYIHKIHHNYKHTVSISSEYAHPIEYLINNIFPTIAGPLILGSKTHLVSVLAWTAYRTLEAIDLHCGYEFPWTPFGIPFMSGGEEYHDFHHIYFQNNYGAFFTFWDSVFGTVSPKYLEYIHQLKQNKH